MLPWQSLTGRGVELRPVPLERIAEAVDERTAVVSVSLDPVGRGPCRRPRRAPGDGSAHLPRRHPGRGHLSRSTSTGSTTSSRTRYKWLLCPRGLAFLYVSPERRAEIEPWTAGWKSRPDPYEDYYGLPELTDDARRLDVSLPWFSAAGGRAEPRALRVARDRADRRAQPRPGAGADGRARPPRGRLAHRLHPGRRCRGRRRAAARRRGRLLRPRRLGPALVPPLQRRGGRRAGGDGASPGRGASCSLADIRARVLRRDPSHRQGRDRGRGERRRPARRGGRPRRRPPRRSRLRPRGDHLHRRLRADGAVPRQPAPTARRRRRSEACR